jgi:hypothetical protein
VLFRSNLGWKLAAVIRSGAPEVLLDTYEGERRPIGLRNTGFARRFADAIGLYRPSPAIEDEGPAGEAARRRAGAYLEGHARAEFDIPGFTLGARYDGSPIIAEEASPLPPDSPTAYAPSARPGGRAPHVWLADGRSLYDGFGFDWTLLRLGPKPREVDDFVAAAVRLGVALKVVDCDDPEAHDLYESDLALIRPDQIVAWRRWGRAEAEAGEILARAVGHAIDRHAAA